MARIRALIALLACLAVCAPALAQSLQRLTVTQLTLSSNQAAPQVEVPFDLVVTAHVRERIAELRNLDLPVLTDVELLGDEHTLVASADGSKYTEHVRVVAHHSGTITIGPVTLDAIDARDGKAKRYSSNSLTLAVHGGVTSVISGGRSYDITGFVMNVLRWLLAIVVALMIVRLLLRRRRAPTVLPAAPQPEPAPVPVVLVQTREQRLRDARTVLQAEPTRKNVLHVRTVVREMVGANDDETLSDVLRRTGSHDATMRALLIALERAAFTHEDDFQRAVADVLARLSEAA